LPGSLVGGTVSRFLAQQNFTRGVVQMTADGFDSEMVVEEDQRTREWAMWLHLSLFAGLVVPLLGLIAPFVIWQVKKEELPGIDPHGLIVMNWIISLIIYGIAFFVLSFLLIGIPFLIALAIAAIVYPILGGIRASRGQVWRYPFSLRFLK
jgi:uncharacterized Tic20 family protein